MYGWRSTRNIRGACTSAAGLTRTCSSVWRGGSIRRGRSCACRGSSGGRRTRRGRQRARLRAATIDEAAFFGVLDEAIFYLDEPVGDPGVVAQFIVDRMAAEESKVVFSGQGANGSKRQSFRK